MKSALLEQAQQRAAGAVGIAQAELLDGLRRDAAPGQVAARRLARRSDVEIGAKILLRQLVHLQQRAAQPGILVGVLRALGHGNAVALGQRFERLVKAEALRLLHELEDVAAGAARKTLVELVHHVDGEGGPLLVVERAQPHVAVGPPERRSRTYSPHHV